MNTGKEINDNKKELRDKIVQTANDLFMLNGIKDVKMDDIAAKLGISKRTLYELFRDKEQLLLEGMKLHQCQVKEMGEIIVKKSSNVLEVILRIYYLYLEKLRMINRKFFDDIKKYPQVTQERKKHEEQNNHLVAAWLRTGVEQGIFRSDINFDIFLYILRRDMEFINNTNLLNQHSIEELGENFVLLYLRGASTEKGRKIIEEYKQKNK